MAGPSGGSFAAVRTSARSCIRTDCVAHRERKVEYRGTLSDPAVDSCDYPEHRCVLWCRVKLDSNLRTRKFVLDRYACYTSYIVGSLPHLQLRRLLDIFAKDIDVPPGCQYGFSPEGNGLTVACIRMGHWT
jgi:hypothetical protein